MEEIKEYKKVEKEEEKPEEPNLIEKVDEIYDALKDTNKKEIKIPRRSKIKRGRMRKGWFGVIYINENGNIWGSKEKVDDHVFREKKAIRYHATDGREILFWLGKFPVIIQPTWQMNPLNVREDIKEKNKVYGQKYIMARMLADVIKIKKAGGKAILWIIGIAVLGYLAYTLFTGGF